LVWTPDAAEAVRGSGAISVRRSSAVCWVASADGVVVGSVFACAPMTEDGAPEPLRPVDRIQRITPITLTTTSVSATAILFCMLLLARAGRAEVSATQGGDPAS
jgi:hypothetical protein